MVQAISADAKPTIPERTSLGRDALTGAIAGQISGLVMAMVMMLVFTLFLGKGPLYPVQVIGSFVFGDAALEGFHLGAFASGLILHQLGPSLVWGTLFGVAVNKLGIRAGAGLVALAIGIGLGSQIVDVNLLMGPMMNALHGHDIWAEQVPAFWSWAAHLVFGLGLLVFPQIASRLDRRA